VAITNFKAMDKKDFCASPSAKDQRRRHTLLQ